MINDWHKRGMTLLTALCLVIGFSVSGAARADAKDAVYTSLLSSLAVSGHDPVAYFRVGKPVKGSAEFSMKWNEATWRFANAQNLADFKKTPEKYAPQFGGYCAWAVSQGYTASSDPEAWRIEGGKLYLNYSKSVQQTWAGDIPGNIKKANANWPKVLE